MINTDDKTYYVGFGNSMIDRIDIDNDTMSSISSTTDKTRWKTFTLDEAKNAVQHTGWKIVEIK